MYFILAPFSRDKLTRVVTQIDRDCSRRHAGHTVLNIPFVSLAGPVVMAKTFYEGPVHFTEALRVIYSFNIDGVIFNNDNVGSTN